MRWRERIQERDQEQMSLLEDIDARDEADRYRKEAMALEKIREGYMQAHERFGYIVDRIPSGTVMIARPRDAMKEHFYRVVAGHHRTVSGSTLHIIIAPNAEWPEHPPWMLDNERGIQWTYPEGFYLYVKREEPETEVPAWDE